ncbi:hypothetical protein ACMU_08275 [Actibacterium mucosum KCTC 23349]|uniref:Uncharacterized protein n=1 Tax=Actibacterium mucosum KCTC 23349 TaxID=1454373 RepID=A0A037ZJG0_9RHOB|nr:hypothetical protein ACMU_08275 [Actibacterium mucosum KCTC 23349]
MEIIFPSLLGLSQRYEIEPLFSDPMTEINGRFGDLSRNAATDMLQIRGLSAAAIAANAQVRFVLQSSHLSRVPE